MRAVAIVPNLTVDLRNLSADVWNARPVKGILDESRLDGIYDIGTALRPLRAAEILPVGDLASLFSTIERNCQIWGGGGTVLVPSTDGKLSGPYVAELIRSDVDDMRMDLFGDDACAPKWIDHGMGRPHPALLIADGMGDRREWSPFRVADLNDSDPWKPIYAATIGLWPVAPSPELFPHWQYDAPPESFEMFFAVERLQVSGSLDDLINRMTVKPANWPRTLSLLGLASGMRPNTGYIAVENVLPNHREARTAAGPNIIVVFGDDPASDAALLWNLRAAHGSSYALPIGIPRAELTKKALASLRKPGLFAAFGLSGGAAYLTSASVPIEELSAFAALHPEHKAVTFDQLLSFGCAPAIPHNQVTTFTNGLARVVPETEADTKLLYPFGRRSTGPQLQLDVIVDNDHIPMSQTMRGTSFGPRFLAGRASSQVPSGGLRSARTVQVEWPTPWLRLQCVARDLQLEVEVSGPGHAALALLDALGGISQVHWLAHPGLIRLLYKLAERSGMTWWKKRWTDARKEIDSLGIDESAFEELAQSMGRDDAVIAPSGEGRELEFQEFIKAFGNREKAATSWLRWAEQRHLVVRGFEVRCDKCKARSWIPIASVPPMSVTCPGCGRPVKHPFPPRHLQFTYRLGEVLRRAMENDCLDHLFALRHMYELFRDKGLVGIHPGANFRNLGDSDVVAEADVLMLFADGSLVPGEVKRTGAGVTPTSLAKLDATVARLEAPWSFLAVGQAARECGSNVPSAIDREHSRPRLVITTDQTFTTNAIWGMGADPFAWRPRTRADDDQRSEKFVAYLRDRAPDAPWSPSELLLLDPPEEEDEAEESAD